MVFPVPSENYNRSTPRLNYRLLTSVTLLLLTEKNTQNTLGPECITPLALISTSGYLYTLQQCRRKGK